jgi:hypothetical protein
VGGNFYDCQVNHENKHPTKSYPPYGLYAPFNLLTFSHHPQIVCIPLSDISAFSVTKDMDKHDDTEIYSRTTENFLGTISFTGANGKQ